ncbi:MAG: glucose-6-phosphate isomerase [Actinobacteria bacterium]|nr:MAG: glucose-6-phosphate isomerase [Actinomycetota bacterium]
MDITATSSWKKLVALGKDAPLSTLSELFLRDPQRVQRTTLEIDVGGATILADFSKQNITPDVVDALLGLAQEASVSSRRDAMFAGEPINTSEGQPALHVALRAPSTHKIVVDGLDVVKEVHRMRRLMADFATGVRSGKIVGATGKQFTQIINVGIGGSDLGPALVWDVLSQTLKPSLHCSFVSNIDPVEVEKVLERHDAQQTLVVMCSKTFSTTETLSNSRIIQQWLAASVGKAGVAQHCVVVTVEPQRARDAGIEFAHSFDIWHWVGGRFSVSSAVNLVNVVAFGPDVFDDFLSGMRAVDEHFIDAPLAKNIPVMMGLISVWNRSILDCATQAIVPYATALRLFAPYLQQLIMESNGKQVSSDNAVVTTQTSPVVWGSIGTNAQHAFMQMLHQGTSVVPVDLIGFAKTPALHGEAHDSLMANMFAQAQALAFGASSSEPQHAMPGNRASTVLLASELSARSLGALIALYEHSVFVQGCVWGINSFDQWGVELGKKLAQKISQQIVQGETSSDQDASTQHLLQWYLKHR